MEHELKNIRSANMPISKGTVVYTIGIIGSNGKTSTANLLHSIFNSAGLRVKIVSDEKNVAPKRTMTNNEIHKELKNLQNSDIIIVEIGETFLKKINLDDLIFDALIYCHICDNSYENSPAGIKEINSLINSCKGTKTVIINTDDNNWKNIITCKENLYLITYGLGKKATVTASSIECSKEIKFCYCLQRALSSFKCEVIEPMEVPVEMKMPGQHNIYNGLAAITAALIFGISMEDIVSSLKNCSSEKTGISMLYENGFGVYSNVCKNSDSFETGFETVQNFPYENVYLIFDLDSSNTDDVNRKILETIGTWSLTLRVKKIFYVSKDDHIKNSEYFNDFIAGLNTCPGDIIEMEDIFEGIGNIVKSIREKDMLLLFCSKECSALKEKLIEVLDGRIWRGLSEDHA